MKATRIEARYPIVIRLEIESERELGALISLISDGVTSGRNDLGQLLVRIQKGQGI